MANGNRVRFYFKKPRKHPPHGKNRNGNGNNKERNGGYKLSIHHITATSRIKEYFQGKKYDEEDNTTVWPDTYIHDPYHVMLENLHGSGDEGSLFWTTVTYPGIEWSTKSLIRLRVAVKSGVTDPEQLLQIGKKFSNNGELPVWPKAFGIAFTIFFDDLEINDQEGFLFVNRISQPRTRWPMKAIERLRYDIKRGKFKGEVLIDRSFNLI